MPDMTTRGVLVSGGALLTNETDTSVPTYAITEGSTTVTEGNSVSFTVATTNVADSTTLYWTVANYPPRETADFTATSGNFTVNSNSGSFSVAIASDGTAEGNETFRIDVRTGSTTGPVIATSATVTIGDPDWNPGTDITTALWLDASDTSNYSESFNELTSITDKSGNFTVTLDGTPTVVSASLNSLNVWDFNGNESLVTNSGPWASSGNHWAIGIFQWHSTDSTKDSFWSADGSKTYAVSSSRDDNNWDGEIDYDGSNSISTGKAKNDFTASINSSTWTIVSTVFNKTGNQIFGRLNGTTRTGVDTYNSSMNTNVDDVRMMRNRSNQKLNGRMAEFFHVAGAPGTGGTDITDVEKAEGYLAHKWGLTSNLPVSHPYKSVAP